MKRLSSVAGVVGADGNEITPQLSGSGHGGH